MSVILLQVGQCGNQLGACLLNQLFAGCNGRDDAANVFFAMNDTATTCAMASSTPTQRRQDRVLWKARCCLIDTEPKAVEQAELIAKANGQWSYDEQCKVVGRHGAGNNWALGYHEHSARLAVDIRLAIRRAVETCDRLAGFLVLMSLAGGTGSGLGTFTCELLRDQYPHTSILCVPVGPYSAGEVIVQNYNALLSMSHLLGCCDGVMAVANDTLHKICRQRLALERISLLDLNSALSNQLTSLLLPCERQSTCRLPDMCRHLCSHPDYKLLRLYSAPQMARAHYEYSSHAWPGLTRLIAQMVRVDSASEDGMDWSKGPGSGSNDDRMHQHKCLASLLVSRGMGSSSIDTKAFEESLPHCKWTPTPFLSWSHNQPCAKLDKICTLLANSTACIQPLQSLTQKAWHMYTTQAYAYQYTKHGCTDEDFLYAFSNLEQVIANYKQFL